MQHPPPFWAAKALADFVRDQASWRRTKAQQFPDDLRHARSAIALERLASVVEELPTNDRHLTQLVELDAFTDAHDRFVGDEEARRAIAAWGFNDDDPRLEQFRDLLQDLVAITRRARRKPAQERTTPMSVSSEASAQASTPVPALPAVDWIDAHLGDRVMWHAVKGKFAGDQVLTYCAKTLTLTAAAKWWPSSLATEPLPFPSCARCKEVIGAMNVSDAASSHHVSRTE